MNEEQTERTKVTVAFLAYREDSALVLESQRAAIRAFAATPELEPTFVLVDDAWCRVTDDAKSRFLAAHPNARYHATGYPRGQMILGGDCILGQCEAFAELAEEYDADILVKMDADTCMFKCDWIAQFAKDDAADIAGAFDFQNRNHTSVFGLCYALKRRILAPLVADLRKYPAHHRAWEDHEVSSRVFRLNDGRMDSLMRWRSNTNGDDFWVMALAQANDTCIYARAANCAWDFAATPAEERKAFRAKVCEQMKRWNDLIEENAAKETDNGNR